MLFFFLKSSFISSSTTIWRPPTVTAPPPSPFRLRTAVLEGTPALDHTVQLDWKCLLRARCMNEHCKSFLYASGCMVFPPACSQGASPRGYLYHVPLMPFAQPRELAQLRCEDSGCCFSLCNEPTDNKPSP